VIGTRVDGFLWGEDPKSPSAGLLTGLDPVLLFIPLPPSQFSTVLFCIHFQFWLDGTSMQDLFQLSEAVVRVGDQDEHPKWQQTYKEVEEIWFRWGYDVVENLGK
jgi:hypothetical protein